MDDHETVESVRAEFNAALDFALDHINGSFDGMDFLTAWREGQYAELAEAWEEWPKFRAEHGLPLQP